MSAQNAVLVEISEAIAEASALGTEEGARAVAVLTESYDRMRSILAREDKGWVRLYDRGADSQFGLRLQDLKDWGRKLEESVPGAPWIGRGFRVRANFILKDGIQHGGIPAGGSQGVPDIQKYVDDPQNQENYFGPAARRKREHNLYTQGIAFWILDERTKKIEAIPLRQITSELMHPDGIGVVWAYLREWTHVNLETGESFPLKMWYFTDLAKDNRSLTVTSADKSEKIPVAQTHVIFAQHANPVGGLAYGTPDALAAWIWNGIARDAYMDGRSVTEALTRFALKATAKNKPAADNVAMQYATAHTAGGMAVVGGANDIQVLQGAQKGYEFNSLRPLLAVIATALDIPTTVLTSDTGDDSYASISSLDLPTRLAMQARRDEHIAFEKRVLAALGAPNATVSFVPFDTGEEVYRLVQAAILDYQQDTITRQQLADRIADIYGRPHANVPSEDQRPSVLLAKAMAKAAPKPAPAAGASSGNTSVASPAQGRSNGTGGQQGGNASNDIRRD
ncbi:hypothetical protein [Microbacterium sp. T32]|uniref:hypothetical protein n=1 Tax=Microbacterium sp. T32 TaxID=1776083 RepID=UPI0007AB7A63|nr:hypothetical protein [Microbacterium sp. T32]KZE41351.1 hypothetical protein AVW09_01845 [Microbacterium sp. T32]